MRCPGAAAAGGGATYNPNPNPNPKPNPNPNPNPKSNPNPNPTPNPNQAPPTLEALQRAWKIRFVTTHPDRGGSAADAQAAIDR